MPCSPATVKDEDHMTELHRWNDDRLDDLAREVHENSDVREELARVEERLGAVNSGVAELTRKLEQQDQDRLRERKLQADERKADRRWMIGTALVVAGLIIAALGIFLG